METAAYKRAIVVLRLLWLIRSRLTLPPSLPQKLRQCLHARAAAQDHLRSAVQESAADLFEAEEFMTFEPGGFSGQAAPQDTLIFPAPSDADGDRDGQGEGRSSPQGGEGKAASGVARARAAASEALRTSLRLARERVGYLEGLAREVQGGGGGGGGDGDSGDGERRDGSDGSPVGETRAEEDGGGGEGVAVAAVDDGVGLRRDLVGDGGGRGGDGRGNGGKDGSVVDVSGQEEEEEGSVRAEQTESTGEGGGEGGGDGVTGLRVDGKSFSVDEATAVSPSKTTRGQGEDPAGDEATSRAERQRAPPCEVVRRRDGQLPVGVGAGNVLFSARSGGAGTGGGRLRSAEVGGPAGAGMGATAAAAAADLGEAKRWRMAARRAEASLADLRETFGDALTLSFRCGEEHCRHQAAGGEGQGAAAGSSGDGDGGRGVEVGATGGAGGKADEEDVAVGLGAAGGDAEEAVVSGGSLGTCWGKRRCSSCEARATAVGVLSERCVKKIYRQ